MSWWLNIKKMDFLISKDESEGDKCGLKHMEEVGVVSSQLQLKSSSQPLNKQQVLNRIRHRKSLNRIKGAFECLLGTSKANTASASASALGSHHAFTAP
ncbi:hypothetical protein VNO78_08238 [Psophocarpus tetragonolobus]|uniref:Uncharacterized protein n=1 Tax=Psophocarpus tetragonolobus TaxID=3891 RepID=A0AAN9SUF6_PSOTE